MNSAVWRSLDVAIRIVIGVPFWGLAAVFGLVVILCIRFGIEDATAQPVPARVTHVYIEDSSGGTEMADFTYRLSGMDCSGRAPTTDFGHAEEGARVTVYAAAWDACDPITDRSGPPFVAVVGSLLFGSIGSLFLALGYRVFRSQALPSGASAGART